MDTVLLAAALLPAIALMVFVYKKDKAEPEPIGLVLRVFLLGAASGIVAGIIESILIEGVESAIPAGPLLLFVEYFFCVALVEELCKFFCLNTVKRNPAFNYVFDAVVYSVAAALGFAALENVFYVLDGGLGTAFMRAILSVPGHAADGVIMGIFYGMARKFELHGNKAKARTYYLLSILLPVIEHGFYDAALSTESDLMALVAMAFDLAFIALAFVLVKRTSAHDEPLHPSLAGGRQTTRATGVPHAPGEAGMPPASFGASPYYQQQAGGQGFGAQQPNPQSPSMQTGVQAQPTPWVCTRCGAQNTTNFCTSCGSPRVR